MHPPSDKTSKTSFLSPLVSPAEEKPNPEWIAATVVTQMNHYFQVPADLTVQKALVADWVRDLNGLPKRAITKAFDQWRRSSRSRPTAGDIRRRADGFIDRPPRYHPPGVFGPDDLTPGELQARRARADELMKEFGFYRGEAK